jgi:tetratricopeptide (TPR) repeat protein
MLESLYRHEKNEFEMYIVCFDELSRLILSKMSLPNVSLIPMHQLERGDLPLLEAKHNRSPVEYYWTTTPTIMLRILDLHPEIDILTYLDADLYFFSSPDPIYDELGTDSVAIYEHRFSPETAHMEIFGKYNVGSMTFRNDAQGRNVLNWWRDRCNEWCYMRVENGKYGDQGYLNNWPAQFSNMKVIEHIGAGAGPWNQANYSFTQAENGQVLINQMPLVHYHFHALNFLTPEIVLLDRHHNYPYSTDVLQTCYIPYLHSLTDSIEKVQKVLPDFVYGLFSYAEISDEDIIFAHRRISPMLDQKGFKRKPFEVDLYWDLYYSSRVAKPQTGAKIIDRSSAHMDRDRAGLKPQSDVEFYLEQSNSFLDQDDYEAAMQILSLGLKLFPDEPSLIEKQGEVYLHQGSINAARRKFEAAIQLDAENPASYINLAETLRRLGQKKKAESAARSALKLDPENVDAYQVLARIAGAINLEDLISSVQDKIKEGEDLLTSGKRNAAVKKFKEAISRSANHPALEGIITQLNQVIGQFSARSNMELIQKFLDQGNYEAAEISLTQEIQHQPNNPFLHEELGRTLFHQGKLDEAHEAFNKALEVSPNDAETLARQAKIFQQLDDYATAENRAARALEIDPNNQAALEVTMIIQGTPNLSVVIAETQQLVQKGEESLKTGDRAKSLEFFNQALEKSSRLPALQGFYWKLQKAVEQISISIVLDQANEAIQQGNLPQAKELIHSALDQFSDNPELITFNGDIFMELGEYEAARHEFVKCTVLEPNYLPAFVDLADLYIKTNRREDAREQLEHVLEKDPANRDALNLLQSISFTDYGESQVAQIQHFIQNGQSALQKGDVPSALDQFHKAVETIGDNPEFQEMAEQIRNVISQIESIS